MEQRDVVVQLRVLGSWCSYVYKPRNPWPQSDGTVALTGCRVALYPNVTFLIWDEDLLMCNLVAVVWFSSYVTQLASRSPNELHRVFPTALQL